MEPWYAVLMWSPTFTFYSTRSFICKSGDKVLSRSWFYCNALFPLKKKNIGTECVCHHPLRRIKKSTVQRQKALKNHFCAALRTTMEDRVVCRPQLHCRGSHTLTLPPSLSLSLAKTQPKKQLHSSGGRAWCDINSHCQANGGRNLSPCHIGSLRRSRQTHSAGKHSYFGGVEGWEGSL